MQNSFQEILASVDELREGSFGVNEQTDFTLTLVSNSPLGRPSRSVNMFYSKASSMASRVLVNGDEAGTFHGYLSAAAHAMELQEQLEREGNKVEFKRDGKDIKLTVTRADSQE